MFAYPDLGGFARDEAVNVSCPGRDCADSAVQQIRERGNLPLVIGDRVLAELSQADLVESWAAAVELTPGELSRMCQIAGERLLDSDEDESSEQGLSELVTDAAVLFLLSVRRMGVATPDAIPACRVSYSADSAEPVVALSA
jgi:hypothetical protein